jgi:hypothetical protein
MSENDYQTGYRGGQFHHGMDRAEYDRGRGQKELEDTLGGAGQKTPVNGVAFTLLFIAPFIWMVYPILGFTILAVFAGFVFLFRALHVAPQWGFLIAVIPCIMSFFWGMMLEAKASQVTVYRWIRGILRVLFSFVGITALSAGGKSATFSDIQPAGFVGGFFGTVIIYLIFQRMDLIYFPALAEIKKMQEKLARGERPTRPLLKRMFFGFCWFIPLVMVLNLFINIGARLGIEDNMARQGFYDHYNTPILIVNSVIWYVLCLIGKLPGTGKYLFIERHENDIRKM